MFAVLLYGVPVLVILVTLYTGWLGLRFYIAEVIKAPMPAPNRDGVLVKVVVVGAGVVGMCLALQLRREGAAVVLLDRADADHGASIGNAGWVTPLLCAPLSGPGVPAEVARATLRGDRYLGVRPTPGLLGWTGRLPAQLRPVAAA